MSDSSQTNPPPLQTREESDEDLLAMAANANALGRTGRNEDGTLSDFYTWAAAHPQKDLEVVVHQGRTAWKSAQEETTTKEDNPIRERLSIVSWNLLSDTWYQTSPEEYTHVTEDNHGDWEFRLKRMVDWFGTLDAQILTLQEVDFVLFESHLQPALATLGYQGMVQRPKKMSRKQPCGCATFWKSSLFQLEASGVFSRSLATVLRRGDDGKINSNVVCVVNVHLEASQSEEGADRRARQLRSALEWAERRRRLHSSNQAMPLVVSGDCNTGADAALFTVVRNYSWHGHDLASVYEHASANESMPARHATFCVPDHHYLIDQMWYSHETLHLECLLDPLTEEERETVLNAGLPHEICPSDHVPIGAIFSVVDPPPTETATTAQSKEEEQLSDERKEELRARYQEFMANAPSNSGKLSEEQKAALKEHGATVKAWAESLSDPLERKFAEALRKKKVK